MKIIGLDFGTTNSTISYYNTESKALENFKFGARQIEYIPTIVSYKGRDISIGDAAKKNLTSKNFETYEHFKLRLGKNADEKIENKSKTPIEVTRDFIRNLFDLYKKDQQINNIDHLVMTVPATWEREGSNRTARENIKGIYKELNYSEDEIQLESEPVAAATYFCWAYEANKDKNPKGKKYKGFITVIDYGGGTLDITLCEAGDNDKIRILESFGFGEYNETNGCAGVAFDNAVIEKLIQDNDLPVPKDSSKFIKLRNGFEESKIIECGRVTEYLKHYYDDPDTVEGEVLFSLEYDEDREIDVCCKDLDLCFNKVNAPKLRGSLEQIQQYFQAHKIDSSAQENFKVLLVGGFSNFYAVEKEVRDFFSSKPGYIDKRFEQPFSERNKTLAISRGAALIAAKWTSIEHTCTYNYGYITYALGESDRLVPVYHPIIKKGTDLKELNKPVFADRKERVKHKGGKLWIFTDDGRPNNTGRSDPMPLDESVKELFPNVDSNDTDKWYQIGFSVDKDNIPSIHIRDKRGLEHTTSLNKLIEKIGIGG